MKEKAQVLLKSAIFFVLSCFFLFLSEPSVAQGQEKVQLKEVRVQGNLRVEEDGIRLHLKIRPGDFFDPAAIDRDVKS
ncbi:MAG: POTRA domain-containing protein, partial [Candidatus Binatota bacterium]